MSATAGLHADLTTRFSDFTNSINPVCTAQLPPPHRLLKTIYAVLRGIDVLVPKLRSSRCGIDAADFFSNDSKTR
jgi:hypothetical protein